MMRTELQTKIQSTKLAEALIENKGNMSAAWKKVNADKKFNTDQSASHACSAYIARNKKEISKIFDRLLFEGKSSNLKALADELNNQITANKTVIYNSNGDTKQIEDNTSRLDAIKTTLKLYRLLGSDAPQETTNYSVNIGTINVDKLSLLADKLKSLRTDNNTSSVIDIEPISKG